MKIPMKYIIELGMIRKRDKCAKCKNKMNVPHYHIQLCKKCRLVELDKMMDKINMKHSQIIPKTNVEGK